MLGKLLPLVALLAVIKTSHGFSSGAPKESCIDMVPQHKTPPQTSPFPYAINLQKREVRSGEKLQLVISGTDAAKNFKGFFIQAQVGNIPVGRFDPAPGVKLVDCGDSQSSAATHATSDVKDKVVLTWTPPPGLSETVRFRATVAQDGGTFWVGHLSTPVVIKSR